MGSTGWSYFVPYRSDLGAALQQLREDVFAEGCYVLGLGITRPDMEASLSTCGADTESVLRQFAAQAADLKLPAETRKKFSALVQQLKQLDDCNASVPKPSTIEELLARQGASGTHSILDIVRVSSIAEFGAVHPLPSSLLVELFGTDRPSHREIENKYEEGTLEENVSERWQGVYIIAYKADVPDEIFFAGCSGD